MATQLLYANNAVGTLAAPITNVSTSLTLNVGQAALFPNPGPGQAFYGTLTDAATQTLKEIVLATAVAGNIVSITRAQDGTLAQSWNAGDFFEQCVVAAELRLFQTATTPSGTLIGVQVITATGTYTPTVGTNSIIVDLVGGGGGGGGAAATTGAQMSMGSGGGYGGWVRGRFTSGFSAAAVTIGAAGVGGTGASGTAGGNSTFLTLTAGGGGPGTLPGFGPSTVNYALNGGVGGSATGGFLNVPGAPGPSFTAAGISIPSVSGEGAGGAFGAGGPAALPNAAGNGASGFGAGGGGADNLGSQPARTGGNGAPGVFIVYEYS